MRLFACCCVAALMMNLQAFAAQAGTRPGMQHLPQVPSPQVLPCPTRIS